MERTAAFVCLSDMFEFVTALSIMRCLNIKMHKKRMCCQIKPMYIYLFVV